MGKLKEVKEIIIEKLKERKVKREKKERDK